MRGRPVVGRLAPTPSGALHFGNICAFTAAWLSVRRQSGTLLLRIEDVDRARSRATLTDGIRRDLDWLGLHWDRETAAQSTRDYTDTLHKLRERLYFCSCTRRDLRQSAYAGTCRDLQHDTGAIRFRLNAGPMHFVDIAHGELNVNPREFGDPILVKRDGEPNYNLAVVADDIADGITEVTRGADLLPFTSVQIQLWQALMAEPPAWLHAPLVLGADHRKLAKSQGSISVGVLREAGWSAQDIFAVILPWLGLSPNLSLDEAARDFVPTRATSGPWVLHFSDSPSAPSRSLISFSLTSGGTNACDHDS